MYDLIIIGAGPAGITATVYAARKKMDFLVISGDIGGQAAWSGDIENYTGYQFITGPELASKFEEHMRKYGVAVKEQESVLDLSKIGDRIVVKTDKGQYESRTAIVASGKRSRELSVPGEKEFKNKGLTYCATCDGPLFAGKDVAVIGGGNSALDAVLQLTKIASHIYLVNIVSHLTGDPVMIEKVNESGIVTVMNSAKVLEITGDRMVSGIRVRYGGEEKLIPVGGIFVEIGLIPNSHFAPDLDKNAFGEIKVDCYNRTNVPGIFAAGDVTDVPEKQIIIAAGEGSKASLSAFKYLNQLQTGPKR
jgi:alkyl hydroperoxide reductase subunit F